MSSIKHRHLSRTSAHRQALLRNLVTSLIEQETITTTWAKAKEAQMLAEKLISLGKRNTPDAKRKAQAIFYEPEKHMDKLFGPLRERYLTRPGGYTRVLRAEPHKDDNASSAILSLVDGPKDTRFAMTAKTLARTMDPSNEKRDEPMHPLTALNIRKVTRFRKDGEKELEEEVKKIAAERDRVAKEERREFEKRGTTFEWRYDGVGPGRVRKRRVLPELELKSTF